MQTTYYSNQIALTVNHDGKIVNIIANSYSDISLKKGEALVHIFDNDYMQTFYDTFSKILIDQISLGFRATLINNQNAFVFLMKHEHIVTLFAIGMQEDVINLFDEIVKINNEQINMIRTLYKNLSNKDEDYSFLEEMMKVNNALINTRRELSYKNKQLNRLNKQLEEINFTDYLTKIYNRRKFFVDVYEFVKESPYTLTMMDFNNFKLINDDYGHNRGDEALQFFANELTANVTSYQGVVYRLGGDEFATLIKADKDIDIETLILKIDKQLKQFHKDVSIAYGSVVINETNCNDTQKIELSMAKADELMYKNKRRYYNQLD